MPSEEKKDDKGNAEGQIEGLSKAFAGLQTQMTALPGQISKAVASGLQSVAQQSHQQRSEEARKAEEKKEESEATATENDLEKMSRAEFGSHLFGRFDKMLDKKLKPFKESLSTTVDETQKDKIEAKFIQARKDLPDFDEWKTEMAALIETRGYLDPSELHAIVRAKNPEKAAKIDEVAVKAKAEQDEKNNEEKAPSQREKPAFLGLTPTSAGDTGGKSEKKFDSAKGAAEAAFDEVMGGIPDSVVGETAH